MKTYLYTAHIEPAEEGGYNVFVPALPGCVTQGETYEEALAMAQEAIQAYVESLIKAGDPIPEEPPPSAHVEAVIRVRAPAA
jgi:antitoxin HicB